MNIKSELNQRIDKNGMHGYIKYIGPLEGKKGTWVGILLDNEDGKNYGSYNDVQYFECYGKKRGVFVIADKLFVNPEKDYKEKYEKLMIHSKAKQNILENRSDTKVMKYKALVKKRDKEIEELNKKIAECGCRNGKIGQAQLKEKIEELSKKVENMANQVNSAKEDLLHIQSKPKTVSNIRKNQYRNSLVKLLEAVNDDELFVAQYKKFMSM